MTDSALRLTLLTLDRERRLRYHPDAILRFDESGRITEAGPVRGRSLGRVRDLRPCIAIPGLIDAHCHLSQYSAVASEETSLLPWLKRYIFPLESAFKGENARRTARGFFAELAAHGTTTACAYTSVWRDSTHACFEEALASGMRVVMGKVMMDRRSYDRKPGPSRTESSLKQSEELCRVWHQRDRGRLLYAFTPRFALSCTTRLMQGAARLAKQYDAYLQTHLSENHAEVRETLKTFGGPSYTAVYDRAGLLGPKTLLAHCIWLREPEFRLIGKRKPAVVHCPTSNAFLASGIMNLGRLRQTRAPLALGSDVAGGPTLSMFEVMRQAVYGQRWAKAHGLFKVAPETDARMVFGMATLGGAEALGLAGRIGTLERGKDADFVVVDPRVFTPIPGADGVRASSGGNGRSMATARPGAVSAFRLTGPQALAQLVYRGGRACVTATYVAGRLVHRRKHSLAA